MFNQQEYRLVSSSLSQAEGHKFNPKGAAPKICFCWLKFEMLLVLKGKKRIDKLTLFHSQNVNDLLNKFKDYQILNYCIYM